MQKQVRSINLDAAIDLLTTPEISNHMVPKKITEEHEYVSSYHNFCTRQLDEKILIIPLFNSNLQNKASILFTAKL